MNILSGFFFQRTKSNGYHRLRNRNFALALKVITHIEIAYINDIDTEIDQDEKTNLWFAIRDVLLTWRNESPHGRRWISATESASTQPIHYICEDSPILPQLTSSPQPVWICFLHGWSFCLKCKHFFIKAGTFRLHKRRGFIDLAKWIKKQRVIFRYTPVTTS